MTEDQVGGLVRGLVAAFSGIAVAYGIEEKDWLVIAGVLGTLATMVWSYYIHSPTMVVRAAAAHPDVIKIEAEPELAYAANSNKVILAPHDPDTL